MGAQQSRPEGVIFYNENVPLQVFKAALLFTIVDLEILPIENFSS